MEILTLLAISIPCGTAWTCLDGGPMDDCLECVEELPSGAVLMAGSTMDESGLAADGWLLCASPSTGDVQWERTFGGPGDDCIRALVPASDGSTYAVGETAAGPGDSDLWVMKLGANGECIWQKTFGGDLEDAGTCAASRPGGGLYAGGYTWSTGAGGCDLWILALDAVGNEDWSRTVGGQAQDKAFCMTATADGGVIAGGMTFSFQARGGDAFLAAFDSEGRELWSGFWGGESYDYAMGLHPTADGGAAAVCWSKRMTCAMMILEVSGQGQLRDSVLLETEDDLRAEGIEPLHDGWCTAGTSENPVAGDRDFFVWGLGAGMDSLWLETVGGAFDEVCRDMTCTSSGMPVLVGSGATGRGDTDGWAVCIEPAGTR